MIKKMKIIKNKEIITFIFEIKEINIITSYDIRKKHEKKHGKLRLLHTTITPERIFLSFTHE